jgi:hypothetical protein
MNHRFCIKIKTKNQLSMGNKTHELVGTALKMQLRRSAQMRAITAQSQLADCNIYKSSK